MTNLFRPQGAFGWFSYTTSWDTIGSATKIRPKAAENAGKIAYRWLSMVADESQGGFKNSPLGADDLELLTAFDLADWRYLEESCHRTHRNFQRYHGCFHLAFSAK